ncbi:hypothetical protein AMS61_08860 [Bacillus sp. FJAT-21351]|nr:hypothetical protein AMS61_08860 [Bacillus sp. FJAT-21351]
MLNEINISAAQFRKLVTLYSIGSTIIVVPAAITADAHQDAWIAALFLQGIEVIIAIIWFLTLFFKVSLYFHASIAGLCHIFNVNETRFLTLPMGLIVTTFSIIVYPTIIYQKTWLAETWIPYSFFVGAFYPFILLIIGWIRFRPAKIKKIIKST